MVVTNVKGTEMKRMQTMAAGLLMLASAVASPLAIAHATLKIRSLSPMPYWKRRRRTSS
jgi:hypothetical protein